MKSIVCYGDSNTWGYIPITGDRLPFDQRWTGRVSLKLGADYRVEEEGLNGRTTSFNDPLCPMRCGTEYIDEIMMTDCPADLVILMLGTNDSKVHLRQTAHSIASGMERLITAVRKPEYGPMRGRDGRAPEVLVISPIHIGEGIERTVRDFDNSSARVVEGLAPLYEQVSLLHDCYFMDAAVYASASLVDDVHMTAGQHARLADAIIAKVKEILE